MSFLSLGKFHNANKLSFRTVYPSGTVIFIPLRSYMYASDFGSCACRNCTLKREARRIVLR